MQSRNRPSRVTKPTATRRPNRRIDEDQLVAQFGVHGNTVVDETYSGAASAVASALAGHQHDGDGADSDEVMAGAAQGYKAEDDGDADADEDGDAEAEPDPEHSHGPNVDAMEVQGHHHHHQHQGMPMAPMGPGHEPHHGIDSFSLQGQGGLHLAAAATAVRDFTPPVGSTIPAPQPLVAATDFQPNPPPTQPPSQPIEAAPSPSPPPSHDHQQQQQQASSLLPPPQSSPRKSTEQMAHESGYEGFKVDSAFAKRMSRDPGQRMAEQRRHGQDLNLVRRSNVEALFAQIAGTEAANPCTHCRKGQGPWTACVVYSGQMMGSCANCWFNASGSRCSFHEKSQPVPPAINPYAVALPISGAAANTGDQLGGPAGNGSAFITGTSPAQLQAAALWNASGGLFSHDAGVKGTVQSALLQVRQATPYQRALIQVEVAAKQLALKIVEAEEIAGTLGSGDDSGDGSGDGDGEGDEDRDRHEQQEHDYDSPLGNDGQEVSS